MVHIILTLTAGKVTMLAFDLVKFSLSINSLFNFLFSRFMAMIDVYIRTLAWQIDNHSACILIELQIVIVRSPAIYVKRQNAIDYSVSTFRFGFSHSFMI